MIKKTVIVLIITFLLTACYSQNDTGDTVSENTKDVTEISETYIETVSETLKCKLNEPSVATELLFEYCSNNNSVILTDGTNILDSITLNPTEVFYKNNECFDSLNLGPYFIVKSTFKYLDSESKETFDIPNYTIYNVVNEKIQCVRFVSKNGEIENVVDPFVYGIPCDNGFTVYLKKHRCIENSGKYDFTYNKEENIFYGDFTGYDSECLQQITNEYLSAQDFIFKIYASSIETKYTNDKNDYYKDGMYPPHNPVH